MGSVDSSTIEACASSWGWSATSPPTSSSRSRDSRCAAARPGPTPTDGASPSTRAKFARSFLEPRPPARARWPSSSARTPSRRCWRSRTCARRRAARLGSRTPTRSSACCGGATGSSPTTARCRACSARKLVVGAADRRDRQRARLLLDARAAARRLPRRLPARRAAPVGRGRARSAASWAPTASSTSCSATAATCTRAAGPSSATSIRQAPFGRATLRDAELQIDFSAVTTRARPRRRRRDRAAHARRDLAPGNAGHDVGLRPAARCARRCRAARSRGAGVRSDELQRRAACAPRIATGALCRSRAPVRRRSRSTPPVSAPRLFGGCCWSRGALPLALRSTRVERARRARAPLFTPRRARHLRGGRGAPRARRRRRRGLAHGRRARLRRQGRRADGARRTPTSAPSFASSCASSRARSSACSPRARRRRSRACAPAEQDARLEAWRHSRLALLRSGYQALKRLAHATYYSSPEVYALRRLSRARRTCREVRRDRGMRPAPASSRAGGDVRGPTPPSRLLRRRQRRGRQHRRRDARRGGRARRHRRGGRRTTRAATSTCRRRGPTRTLYQEHGNRATDDLAIIDPAGPLRRRRHDRELDVVVPHARGDAARCGRERHGVRGLDAATLAPHFAAVEQRLSIGPGNRGRRQPQQPQAVGRRREARLEARAHPPQRQGLRAARLLRHGLPARRQAVGARSPTCPTRSPPAPTSTPTAARAWSRPIAARARAVVADVLDRATRPPDAGGASSCTRGAASSSRAAPSTRRRCCCARRPAPAAAWWASAPSCTRRCRWSPSTPSPSRPSTARRSRSPVHHFARSRRARRLLPRDGADAPDAGGARVPRLRRRAPPRRRAPRVRAGDDRAAHRRPPRRRGRQRRRRRRRAASSSHYPLGDAHREAAVDALANMARLQLAAGASEVMTLHDEPLVHPQRGRHRAHRARALRPQPAHALLGAPDGRLRDGRRSAHARWSTRAAATTSSRTSGSPTARSSRPAWASTRSCRSTPTPACSRPRSPRP